MPLLYNHHCDRAAVKGRLRMEKVAHKIAELKVTFGSEV